MLIVMFLLQWLYPRQTLLQRPARHPERPPTQAGDLHEGRQLLKVLPIYGLADDKRVEIWFLHHRFTWCTVGPNHKTWHYRVCGNIDRSPCFQRAR